METTYIYTQGSSEHESAQTFLFTTEM